MGLFKVEGLQPFTENIRPIERKYREKRCDLVISAGGGHIEIK
jgi:hypothetical protein